jgi:DeoR/GlpR family transcriptional regulator of sugar metabolism
MVSRSGFSPGYFSDHLERDAAAKAAIGRAIVDRLADDQAIAITAGTTTYTVARELRRDLASGCGPQNLTVFTNSLAVLLELVATGISTGVLGEIYSAEDCAFHAPEFRSSFVPGIAIVGTSGLLLGPDTPSGLIELFSHRAEEATFLRQLLAVVPEVVIAADSSKLGRRNPWSFGGDVLFGKRVRLVTDVLTDEQRATLTATAAALAPSGTTFTVEETCTPLDDKTNAGDNT